MSSGLAATVPSETIDQFVDPSAPIEKVFFPRMGKRLLLPT